MKGHNITDCRLGNGVSVLKGQTESGALCGTVAPPSGWQAASSPVACDVWGSVTGQQVQPSAPVEHGDG